MRKSFFLLSSFFILSPTAFAYDLGCKDIIFQGQTLYRELDVTVCFTGTGEVIFDQRSKNSDTSEITVKEHVGSAVYKYDTSAIGVKSFSLRSMGISYTVNSGTAGKGEPIANVSITYNGMVLSLLEIDPETVTNNVKPDYSKRYGIILDDEE